MCELPFLSQKILNPTKQKTSDNHFLVDSNPVGLNLPNAVTLTTVPHVLTTHTHTHNYFTAAS